MIVAFSAAAVDTLGLGRFHLVVHDAGGPVGFEMIRLMPERIASATTRCLLSPASDGCSRAGTGSLLAPLA